MTTMTRTVFMAADNTNVLAGTDLDEAPFAGTMVIYGASTQNDTAVTITAPALGPMGIAAPLRAGPLTLRANAEIRVDEDSPIGIVNIDSGQHATINVDIVTAGTAAILTVLTDGSP